jgi:hypothetical protein
MADEDHSTLYPIYMVDTFSPQDATYVRVGTKVERIAKIYGIDSEGRPAKEKKGGYWVETESGRVVKSWLVDRYMIEDPHWFSNNSRSLLEAWSEVAPQVMAAAMLAFWDVCSAVIEAGGEVPSSIKFRPLTIKASQELLSDVRAGDRKIINSLKAFGLGVRENRRYPPSFRPKVTQYGSIKPPIVEGAQPLPREREEDPKVFRSDEN